MRFEYKECLILTLFHVCVHSYNSKDLHIDKYYVEHGNKPRNSNPLPNAIFNMRLFIVVVYFYRCKLIHYLYMPRLQWENNLCIILAVIIKSQVNINTASNNNIIMLRNYTVKYLGKQFYKCELLVLELSL